jgi:Ca2+-binding EF-hand superfamily protein
MISRRNVILAAMTAPAYAGATFAAFAKKPSAVAKFDTDKDGTVDLAEAKKAASDLFDRLDTDKDGTLDIKEVRGRLTHNDFSAADPDRDKTLTKDEYLAVVEKRFKAADADNDGTVSEAEFRTPSGRAFVRLLD